MYQKVFAEFIDGDESQRYRGGFAAADDDFDAMATIYVRCRWREFIVCRNGRHEYYKLFLSHVSSTELS